jgi:hypothetical protein
MALGKFTDINILLDRSGSMAPLCETTRLSINKLLEEQQAVPGYGRVTLAVFSGPGDFKYLRRDASLASVTPLAAEEYVPSGSTALRDATARLIRERGQAYASVPEAGRPEKVIFVIQTDGDENSSVEFRSPDELRAIVRHQETVYKWEFVYLGANQDAILVGAREFGLPAYKAITYAAGMRGMANTVSSTNETLRSYRTGASASLFYSNVDKVESLAVDEQGVTAATAVNEAFANKKDATSKDNLSDKQ